jgi:hypothetical protein
MKPSKKLEKINAKIDAWYEYYQDNISNYHENVAFNEGEQWDGDTVAFYTENGKVMMRHNLLKKFITQIVGEQLSVTPEMQIVVDKDEANQESINLRNDILRTIQIKNHAKECYQTAFECALKGGFGALKYYTDYSSAASFDQDVMMEPKKEPTLCFWDVKAKNKTKSDGDYSGDISYLVQSEFKKNWPNAEPTAEKWDTNSEEIALAETNGDDGEPLIAVAEIYEKKWFKKKMVKVSPTISGKPDEVIQEEDFEEYVASYKEAAEQMASAMGIPADSIPLPQIIDRKTANDYTITCTRLTKVEILEEYDFPGRHLPVIYVDGYSYWLNGKQFVKSITDDAFDAQRSINFIWSEICQHVKNYRRETIYATHKMFEGSLHIIKNPEKPVGYVPFKPDPTVPGGVPIFREAVPIPPELLQAFEVACNNLADILGRTEVAMGDAAPEVSGVAIANRLRQQNILVNKFLDGLYKAIEQGGVVTNDLINNLYDGPREMNLYAEQHKVYRAKLNNFNPDTMQVENQIKPDDLSVMVSVGSNYELQRMEERQFILDILQASAAPAFPYFADKLFGLSNAPNMPELVERAKAIVPPQIIAKEDGKPPPPPPPPPPQVMLEQQKLQMEAQQNAAENQLKAMQIQNDSKKTDVDYIQTLIDGKVDQIKTTAELAKAQMQYHNDMTSSHVAHFKNVKDLAVAMQPPEKAQSSSNGQS